ncbi:C2H2-type zinc finger - like 10 [Theobroma cacao]|nr:C2H2-type zinc finger - like 10 [Theobroma cacao]
MEKKSKTCKICNRRFASGKAMGGHMRSHLAKLPIPPKLSLPSSSSTPAPNNSKSPPPSSSALSRDPSSEVNHMQPYRSELSSETESPRNPTGRRSKRLRKVALNMVGSPSDSVSSIVIPVIPAETETLSSEDAAMCLLMLSKDKWTTIKKEQKEVYYESIDDEEEFDGDGDDDVDENENNDDDDLFCVTNPGAQAHPKYKCETCNRVFKSHQALGGHRASHKNKQVIRASIEEGEEAEGEKCGGAGGGDQIEQQRIFECPFCDKVFQSGQALGGHKKSHFTYLAVADKVPEKSSAVQLFDLNLPAPEYDDES